jgi:hypothetical protein
LRNDGTREVKQEVVERERERETEEGEDTIYVLALVDVNEPRGCLNKVLPANSSQRKTTLSLIPYLSFPMNALPTPPPTQADQPLNDMGAAPTRHHFFYYTSPTLTDGVIVQVGNTAW